MQGNANTGPRLLLAGYGPLLALIIFFALMVITAPTVAVGQLGDQEAAGGSSPSTSDGVASSPGEGGEDPGGDADPDGETTSAGPDDGSGQAAAGAPSGGGGGEGSNGGGSSGGGGSAEAQGCADRDVQVPGDPYSPPCVVFEGDNGGATSRGVTADEIVISARTPDQPGFQDELANLADADIADSQEDVRRTIATLVDYFNDRFEFYGRQLRVKFYDGQGDTTEEALGRGHEGAQADALTVADKFEAFAELNGATEPFGDALAQNGVLAIGALHLSREWMEERSPYSWSGLTDCSTVALASADFANVRLRGRKAEFAGDPAFRDRERLQATIVPENPVYQQCLARAEQYARDAGFEPPMAISYTLDIGTMSNQAANIVAQLQNEEITTVTCSCDPVLPVFLTARAQEQDYHPEWVITGTGFTDQDVVGQLMNQKQWSRAFGISYNAAAQPQEASLGYNAYKAMRDDEPAFAVGAIYYSLYLLAIGIQGAGPELTPATFEQGMFDYPGAEGPAGTWGFGPGNYSAPEDYREIYWDPDEISSFNNEPGAYVETDPGVRHAPGELPEGGPRVPW